MKLITAYIQPHKLNDVKQELFKSEIYKISVTNAMGCGQQKGFTETYRGVDIEVNLLKKLRIEIAINDDFVKSQLEATLRTRLPIDPARMVVRHYPICDVTVDGHRLAGAVIDGYEPSGAYATSGIGSSSRGA